ncbi:hypothetical protein ACQKTA_09095 [Enterococcus sp. 22-H-5-01]|uniref:hypothetical protein n=1 Tax=Enterococcus sp. 22-H-5-01 TaxID=3418555 RepID=UPI003D08762D
MGKIFFDFNGDFQWASVAAVIAGVGAIISLVFSFLSYRNTKKSMLIQKEMDQKKIDADIISKSRMSWMDNAKKITAQFLNDSLSLSAQFVMFNEKILQYNQNNSDAVAAKKSSENMSLPKRKREEARDYYSHWKNKGSVIFDEDMIKRVENINDLLNRLFDNYIMIKLNFSNNTENNKIVSIVFSIEEELRIFSLRNGWNQFSEKKELIKSIEEAKRIRDNSAKKVNELTEILRDYYKKEWEKVKLGK